MSLFCKKPAAQSKSPFRFPTLAIPPPHPLRFSKEDQNFSFLRGVEIFNRNESTVTKITSRLFPQPTIFHQEALLWSERMSSPKMLKCSSFYIMKLIWMDIKLVYFWAKLFHFVLMVPIG